MQITRTRATLLVAGAAALATLAVAGEVWANLAQTPVLNTPRYEALPGMSGANLVWSQPSIARPNHFNAFVRTSGVTTQLNAARTFGFTGGVDGNKIVFQQVSLRGQSDLRMYNVATHQHHAPPAGVNSTAWEYHPTISGNWLLFGRIIGAHNSRVILRSTTSKTSFQLAVENSSKIGTTPGQVNGNWAVWEQCWDDHCSVYRRDIAAKTTTVLVNSLPPARFEYSPSVAADGTAYYIHSGKGCGNTVKLVKQPVGGPETVLNTFNQGIDVLATNASADPTSGTDVLFEKYYCKRATSDIYKVVDP